MLSTATNNIVKTNTYSQKDSVKYVIIMCVVFSALIFGRVASDAVLCVFVAVSLLVFLFSSVSHCFSLLLFLLPLAPILKVDINGMSFFTILFFVFVLKMIVSKRMINANVFISLFMFAFYACCFSGFGQITTIVTMILGMLMIYYLRIVEVNIDLSILVFSFGIIVSSILASLKEVFPIVNTFVANSALRLDSEHYAARFSGLQGNPNYYTLDIIMALAVILVLMYRKSAKPVYISCFVVLSVFGLMSVSKSFLICWVLLIVCWFILSVYQGVGKFCKFLMIVIICSVAIYLCAYDSINTYIFRLVNDNSGSLESITTGRTGLWKSYIDAILNDAKILFLGNGLNTTISSGRGAHNTFLESLFSLGFAGSGLLLISIKSCMGKYRFKAIMLIPIITLVIRMIAIGILTYDNLWYYLAIIACLFKYLESTESEAQNEKVYRVDNI